MDENQDHAKIIMHPPVFYIIAALIGLGIDYFFPLSFGFEGATGTAGILLFILGVIIAILSMKNFAKDKQSPSVHAPTHNIYTSGIYGYTRNPIYLGALIWLMAAAVYFDKAWIFIMSAPLIVFLNKAVIEKEEAYLEEKFGDEYRSYKKKVRRWI
ncbi:methyltransferase family protein [Pseudemcibacter aquimaris]|uniref:methyltransferase family protein n=1 Tax=Pseudemcibacter aquimaris TaxID=2857064 RepID=UPI00201363D8|nr:isoprenylcysteine carboxylmethyltransferase family protein [Pseudemcibacter aquimaris]MCC3862144.1 isoprenylcysteine carboxylmethyltransferase family protein [Pseudemcibacter aquimaris]WDU58897.1 isoprenylcysteine carboxylmethyltransferase family protein [Pseudemcibacter aquimaris]